MTINFLYILKTIKYLRLLQLETPPLKKYQLFCDMCNHTTGHGRADSKVIPSVRSSIFSLYSITTNN